MKLETEIKLYSIRQIADLTGKSKYTIYKYIVMEKIDYVAVDHMRLIPESEIEKIKKIKMYHKSKRQMSGHVTICKFALLVGAKAYNIKRYVKQKQIEHVIDEAGVFFIPNHVLDLWLRVDNPTPGKIEALNLDSVIIQDAGLQLGYSDNTIRCKIKEGELEKVQCVHRWYVTQKSIDKYKLVSELIEGM
jgi:hypothetical protein